jgi:hypothetical protein
MLPYREMGNRELGDGGDRELGIGRWGKIGR